MRKDRGVWRSAWNNIGYVREPMSANVPAVSHILLGVFEKGWVGPGAWLADVVIRKVIGSETPMALIGGEALRAGSATVGVEQGMLRKDFLVDGAHSLFLLASYLRLSLVLSSPPAHLSTPRVTVSSLSCPLPASPPISHYL